MNQLQLYTVKITETLGKVHHYHNLTKSQVDHLKSTVWRSGCLVRKNENTQELISPYMLKEVLIIKQQGMVSGTMDTITQYGKS